MCSRRSRCGLGGGGAIFLEAEMGYFMRRSWKVLGVDGDGFEEEEMVCYRRRWFVL